MRRRSHETPRDTTGGAMPQSIPPITQVAGRIVSKMTAQSPAIASVRMLEQALESRPLDLALHEQLARAHRAVLDGPDPIGQLTALCRDLPYAYTSQLHLAALHQVRGDRRGAVTGSLRAIKTAQLRGFWLDHGSTPPWLVELV